VAWYENNQHVPGGIWEALSAGGTDELLEFVPGSPKMPAIERREQEGKRRVALPINDEGVARPEVAEEQASAIDRIREQRAGKQKHQGARHGEAQPQAIQESCDFIGRDEKTRGQQ
jgi:hypothetical protein